MEECYGVLCDKRLPARLKGKVYQMVLRPALLYGSECWPIKKIQVQRLMATEMRMIRWMGGYTRMDRIMNEVIRDWVKVAPIKDKMRQIRLRWFDLVKRSEGALVRSYERINASVSKRGSGRPKNSLNEVIREDLKVVGLIEDMARDRRLWQDRIKVLDIR